MTAETKEANTAGIFTLEPTQGFINALALNTNPSGDIASNIETSETKENEYIIEEEADEDENRIYETMS